MSKVTNNPKIQETLDYLNKKEFKEFVREHKDAHTVEVGNGIIRNIPLKKAVSILFNRQEIMGEDICEIKKATTVLVDFSKLHYYLKKLKIYWLASLILSLFITHNWWKPLLEQLVKKL